ncbi:MAG: malic enzyme-like NAD(P)-binding protein [Thermodesulfobacteriota bacterium]|mgnify:CR=1 FL=1
MSLISKKESLEYHSRERTGKLEIMPTKPCGTQKELSMAYTPGVAEACREIQKSPGDVYKYTNKGNLVAVVSNGTAVLGLGNIGPAAGKPVMEGKGVLFKAFADVDTYDLNINAPEPEKVMDFVRMLEPTFGGINLEDIKAPECFRIEETLIQEMDIPVFHDDQHGTAIISGAGLINALRINGKKPGDLKIVVSGAGAAAIACSRFYESLGADREKIFMFDSRGLIHTGRDGLNAQKKMFAQAKNYGDMAEVIKEADIFLGLSIKGILTPEMVRSMNREPVIFAMANPDPEISYSEAKAARPDCIVATGRSDFPNQINNVSGFPFIFRGALDVRARKINEEMKVAAAHALADLAREPVPDEVLRAYEVQELRFGPDYILPKPLDKRIILHESPAVAKAAIDSGVARLNVDLLDYKRSLENRLRNLEKKIKGDLTGHLS